MMWTMVWNVLVTFQLTDQVAFELDELYPIKFHPRVPVAGEIFQAECRLVGLMSMDDGCVIWSLLRFSEGVPTTIAINNEAFNDQIDGDASSGKRIEAVHNQGSNLWQVRFNPIRRDDIGNLSCQLCGDSMGRTDVHVTRFLDVHSTPVILDISTRIVSRNLGESLNITCAASGYPPPDLRWIRDDLVPISPDATLTKRRSSGHSTFLTLSVRNLTRKDSGLYVCIPWNVMVSRDRAQTVASSSQNGFWLTRVHVYHGPTVHCQPDRVGQAPNALVDAVLECMIYAYPVPSDLTWHGPEQRCRADLRAVSPSESLAIIHSHDNAQQQQPSSLHDNYKHQVEFVQSPISSAGRCVDGCWLTRLNIFNVGPSDYGQYVVKVWSDKDLLATDGAHSPATGSVALFETTECQRSVTYSHSRFCHMGSVP